MRTKHLLYTMALASVFAACTQDEFVTEGGNSNPLEGRKSLGKITLVEAEGPSTRWVVNDWDEIVPEIGDGFSYFLVDVPRQDLAGQHSYPIDNYQLVNNIQTNYVFKKTAQGFTNDANLVEGNYLLVGPSQNVQGRKPVEITLPAEQNLAFGTDGKVDPLSIIKEFNKSGYPIYIGHRFLSEGSNYNNVLPTRHHIFAYPEITVVNNDIEGATEVPTVVKVILKSEDEEMPFVINAPLNNEKAARLLTNESFKAVEGDKQYPIVVGAWEGYRTETLGVNEKNLVVGQTNEKKTLVNQDAIPADAEYIVKDAETGDAWKNFMFNNGLGGSTRDLLDNSANKTSVSKYIVINMPEGGVDLKAGESFKFNAIIPAAAYDMNENLIMYAVLENGDVWKKVMKANSEKMTINPGKRYPQEDYNGMTLRGDQGMYFTIGVHEGSDGVSTYKQVKDDELEGFGDADAVMTTEQLVAALSNPSSTTTMNITIGGKDVVYDQRAEAALANNKAQIVNILGHIKIESAEKEALTINSKVSFADAVINKGTVVFNSTTATLGTVLVGKDATLELRNAGFGIDSDNDGTLDAYSAEIHNVGTLKLYAATFGDVYNYNVVEVYNDMGTKQIKNGKNACYDGSEIISKPINLESKMFLKAVKEGNEILTATYTLDENVDFPITIESYDKDHKAKLILGKNVEIVGKGEIVNNGIIGEEGDAETLKITRGANRVLTNEKDGVIWNKVIIEGASHTMAQIELLKGVNVADYTKAAQMTNKGILNAVEVNGLLTLEAGSYVNGEVSMTYGGDGEINNTGAGVIRGTVDDGIEVYAIFNGLDLSSATASEAAQKAINGYTTSTKVAVARLTGAVKIGNTDVTLAAGPTIKELDFAANSSLTMGDAKLTIEKELGIAVSAKNILWSGNSENASTFNFNSNKKTKKKYVDVENGKYVIEHGNIETKNCQSNIGTWKDEK